MAQVAGPGPPNLEEGGTDQLRHAHALSAWTWNQVSSCRKARLRRVGVKKTAGTGAEGMMDFAGVAGAASARACSSHADLLDSSPLGFDPAQG